MKQAIAAKTNTGFLLYSSEERQRWISWLAQYDRLVKTPMPSTPKNLFEALIPTFVVQQNQARVGQQPLPLVIKTRVLVPCFVIRPKRYIIVRPEKKYKQTFWVAKVSALSVFRLI